MANKLTQTKFIELMNNVTGHSKNFIKERTEVRGVNGDVYVFAVGEFSYHSWIKDYRYIHTQVFLNGVCCLSFFHDFDTLVNDWEKDEEYRRLD